MITPTLEMCKKLKDKGWTKHCEIKWHKGKSGYYYADFDMYEEGDEFLYYAPTAEEIAEELPHRIYVDNESYDITITKYEIWGCGYWNDRLKEDTFISSKKSLSEALALLWIWCVDNGYIKTKEG